MKENVNMTADKNLIKKAKKVKEKRSVIQHIAVWIVFVLFLLYTITLIYPFFYIVINAFKTTEEFTENFNGFPRIWCFKNFADAFAYKTPATRFTIIEMFFVSVLLAFGGTFLTMASSASAAYVVAKYSFKGREVIYTVAVFSMIVPIVGTLPSTLRLLKAVGIYNTPIAILFLSSGGFGMNFLLLYSFFKGLSWGYAEAAYMDGATDVQIFLKIMIPLAKGPLVAISIITLIGLWNDYANPAIFLPGMPSLAVGMQQIIEDLTNKHAYPQVFASVIIALMPIFIIYICFSKTIMVNTTVGGLKG